ncbi:flagellar hook-basal body protein [Sphingorhabdus sp. Alg239-R122]|uniref:flagellar hook-basal body protein n=1 Tax=Sphingorhabdus sp. Alg239-R122 TaxID=2305989 RepID=UPI0013DB07EF|nr:flagellar hook-basal body protein [Sphingorhabdus sp. Alg239-R122]
MNGAFYVGAVGLESQQQALDTIANNIANLNTPTFKRSDVRFTEIMASRLEDAVTVDVRQRAVPAGVIADSEFMLLEQGDLRRTGRALDIAVNGPGFIELLGPGGQTYLWRGGTLKVTEEGLLAASNNMPLRAMINIPENITDLNIDSSGLVRAITADDKREVELGQINLVKLTDSEGIERLDGSLYLASPDVRIRDAAPGEDGVGLIEQGAIEGSNVKLTEEMVQLTLVQRSFAANAQVVQAADQLMGIANGLRR